MTEPHLLRRKHLPVLHRGTGIQTQPSSSKELSAQVTSGITRFPPRAGIPPHYHNCDEQTTVLEGEAEVGARCERVGLFDTADLPAGVHHGFVNLGSGRMTILWFYRSRAVTRTFVATGETLPHLSDRDLAAGSPPPVPS